MFDPSVSPIYRNCFSLFPDEVKRPSWAKRQEIAAIEQKRKDDYIQFQKDQAKAALEKQQARKESSPFWK